MMTGLSHKTAATKIKLLHAPLQKILDYYHHNNQNPPNHNHPKIIKENSHQKS